MRHSQMKRKARMSGCNRSKNSESAHQRTVRPSSAPRPHKLEGISPQDSILAMHHNAGNQAVNELLESGADNRSHDVAYVPPIVYEGLCSSGQPLDPKTRASMESRFGHDFGQVRVHTDKAADKSAATLLAKAYTLGNDIAFS